MGEKVHPGISAIVLVRLAPGTDPRDVFFEIVKDERGPRRKVWAENVRWCVDVLGQYDLVMKISAGNSKELSTALHAIYTIKGVTTETMVIHQIYKQESETLQKAVNESATGKPPPDVMVG